MPELEGRGAVVTGAARREGRAHVRIDSARDTTGTVIADHAGDATRR